MAASGLAEVGATLRRPPFNMLLTICEAADASDVDDLVTDALRLVGSHDLSLLRVAASAEIGRTRDAPQLFRSTSVASKLLSRFTRSNRDSMSWLRATLEKPVASILDSRVVLVDLDGKDKTGGAKKGLLSRTVSSGAVDAGSARSSGEGDSSPSTIHLTSDAKRSLARLESLAKSFLDSILSSTSRIPRSFRELCHHMQTESFKKFGDGITLTRGEFSCCSSFVFLRFICPAILTPHSFGLAKSSPPPDVVRTLVLVSKVLTAAANGTTLSEPQFVTLNAFLLSVQPRITEFFTYLCSNPDRDSVSSTTDAPLDAASTSKERKTLFASSPVLRPERDKPPPLPDVSRVTSLNREERALLQVLSWAAKHAFTVQTSINDREDLTPAERVALSGEWETFLAALMRLPPDLLVPQPRSSRTSRSARGEKEKDSPSTNNKPKEARKSRLLETIGDWLDSSESRARKARAKSEAAPRPTTQDLLLALETPEVSSWLVDMERKGGDSRQAVLYIYALLEELYRLRTEAERRPRAPSRSAGSVSASPSLNMSLSSPASASSQSSSRKSSLKRRVIVNDLDPGLTSPRRNLAESAGMKDRRERRDKDERELSRSNKKSSDKKDKEREKEREKEKEKKERKKETDRESDKERGSRIVPRTTSASPAYAIEKRPSKDAERRRSVNYSPSVNHN